MLEADIRILIHSAALLGVKSKSAKALLEYQLRKDLGEDVTIYETPHAFVVGPKRNKESQ